MALKPCRECGQQVSIDAKICPHCGVRFPVKGAAVRNNVGCLVLIGIALFVLVAIFSESENNPEPKIGTCESDWTKCTNNEQLANNYSGWEHMRSACKTEANDRAKYGTPVWPWPAFGHFFRGNNYVTSGIAVAVEPDAQFQNGFGAMVRSRVVCTYDLRTNRVVDVVITER